jgi:hypothetical protein
MARIAGSDITASPIQLVARTQILDTADGLKATCLQDNSGARTATSPSMRYKVTFRKRFSPDGEPADDPKSLIDTEEGVVQDAEIVEILEPAGVGVAEDMNEGSGSQESNDNGFLNLGTETWVYDIAEGREKEFTDELVESKVVLDYEIVPDETLGTLSE